MKKALIITYYWPPSGGAGVQRWLKFVKYMQDFGWEPIVYTAANPENPVIDESLMKEIPKNIQVLKTKIWEPYSFYKKFTGRKKSDKINASFLSENKAPGLMEKISVWIRGNYFIPDARKFWIKPSVKYLDKFLSENKIDCIISSGPPHSMHLIAMALKKKHPKIKWLADFRDPWTHIDFYDKLMLSDSADKLHHTMERDVILNADLVISIGNEMSEQFQEIIGSSTGKFKVISNGYDESDLHLSSEIIKDKKFSMAHIGTMVKDRNPVILWKVLKKIISENSDFKNNLEIKLVGKLDISVQESLKEFGLTEFVNKIEYVPHNEVSKIQQESKVLLLIVNNTKNAKGILTGKAYEYIASGTPILAIGPLDGEAAHLLNKTKTGLISDFDDEQMLEKNILALYNNQFFSPDQNEIKKYSRKELTKELCAELDKLVSE